MDHGQIGRLLSFIKDFKQKYDDEQHRLPYHVNIIDELHINENGHSRILCRLLCYVNKEGEYELLQSLLSYIVMHKKASDFGRIRIETPTITQEEKRIDLWVRDTNYAIIFENKIYNAVDQDAQIARYIETTKEKYNDEQIFIIYLSQTGEEPDPQTWKNENLKEVFAGRYVNLSFRNDILPWLEKILPTIQLEDCYLQSAIQQYVDYLKGFFSLRNIQKSMAMEMEKLISKYLNLDTQNESDCLKELSEFSKSIEEISKVTDTIKEGYIFKLAKKVLGIVKEELLQKYNVSKVVVEDVSEQNKGYFIALSILYEGKKIAIVVAKTSELLYCQVQYDYNSVDKSEWENFQKTELAHYLLDKKILTQKNHTGVWKWYGSPIEEINYIEVSQCFKYTVEQCIEFISNNPEQKQDN